ncbi:hypothetical protein LZ30DRAFT_621304 [Colletotrichum cereale]|nr:hypothetical protein LZ30DRAFT_621304 [Colletotrichum cereale]
MRGRWPELVVQFRNVRNESQFGLWLCAAPISLGTCGSTHLITSPLRHLVCPQPTLPLPLCSASERALIGQPTKWRKE